MDSDRIIKTKKYGHILEHTETSDEIYIAPSEVMRFNRAFTISEGMDFGIVKCMDIIDCLACGRTGNLTDDDVKRSVKNLSEAVYQLMGDEISRYEKNARHRIVEDPAGELVIKHVFEEMVYLVNAHMCDGYPAPYAYSCYTGAKADAYVMSLIDDCEAFGDVDELYVGIYVIDMGDLF